MKFCFFTFDDDGSWWNKFSMLSVQINQQQKVFVKCTYVFFFFIYVNIKSHIFHNFFFMIISRGNRSVWISPNYKKKKSNTWKKRKMNFRSATSFWNLKLNIRRNIFDHGQFNFVIFLNITNKTNKKKIFETSQQLRALNRNKNNNKMKSLVFKMGPFFKATLFQ